MRKIFTTALIITIVAASLSACGNKGIEDVSKTEILTENTGTESDTEPIEIIEPSIEGVDDKTMKEEFEREQVDAKRMIGFSQFDHDFITFTSNLKSGENYSVSPISLKMALGLLTAGADGNTLDELLFATGFQSIDEYITWCQTVDGIQMNDKETAISIGYGIWHNSDKDGKFKKEYKEQFKGLDVEFTEEKGTKLQGSVNKWVNNKTNGLIPELVSFSLEESVNTLVNTIYLKGAWFSTFEEHNTSIGEFVDIDGNIVEKDFMHQEDNFLYYEDNGTQMVIMPLTNGCRMAFVLGDDAAISEKINQAQSKLVNISLPKFETETSIDSLKPYLQEIGVKDAFEDTANFSAMMDCPTKVDEVLQKTKVIVDENGVEAAAATAVIMVENAAFEEPEKPVYFTADSPFSYFIYSDMTGEMELLFYGEYVK